MDRTLKKLGKTIKEQREFLGMSLEEFADRCGVTQPTIKSIEDGLADMKFSTMFYICGGLELTPADLWDLVEGRDFFSMNSKGEVAK